MNKLSIISVVGVLYVTFFLMGVSNVHGHSYLCEPNSRSLQCGADRGQRGFGPCDSSFAASQAGVISASRGQRVPIKWPRNNHPGGVIRIAFAPVEQSDNPAAFDANVIKRVCHEQPCNAANQASTMCETFVDIPAHLKDGTWTMQWAWYGGGQGLSDYYSCVDFNIRGGATGPKPAETFTGGDARNKDNSKCFICEGCATRLGLCKTFNEPCFPPAGALDGEPTPNHTPTPSATTGSAPAPATGTAPAQTTGTQASTGSTPTPTPGNCAGVFTDTWLCDGCGLGRCYNQRYFKYNCPIGTYCSGGQCINGACPMNHELPETNTTAIEPAPAPEVLLENASSLMAVPYLWLVGLVVFVMMV
jgi:hypothetical protein